MQTTLLLFSQFSFCFHDLVYCIIKELEGSLWGATKHLPCPQDTAALFHFV
jgi:hypothetical protein